MLSQSTLDTVNDRNARLKSDMDVGIGVVTCNSGGDLYAVALDYAEDMGLGSYDFIVVLDISGKNYRPGWAAPHCLWERAPAGRAWG